MVSFILNKCISCNLLQETICAVDGTLAQYGKNAWQNISFLTTKAVPQYKIRQLTYYKEILNHLQWNQDFYCSFSMNQIVSRVSALTSGEQKITKGIYIQKNPITTTTTTTTTTSTTSTTTSTTSTTSTSTSTTSTTTTSTTTVIPLVVVDNNAEVGEAIVQSLTLDGNTPSGLNFPIGPNQSDSGTTVSGTSKVMIVGIVSEFGSIQVIDSVGNIQCQNYTGALSYSFTLATISGANNVTVTIRDIGTTC